MILGFPRSRAPAIAKSAHRDQIEVVQSGACHRQELPRKVFRPAFARGPKVATRHQYPLQFCRGMHCTRNRRLCCTMSMASADLRCSVPARGPRDAAQRRTRRKDKQRVFGEHEPSGLRNTPLDFRFLSVGACPRFLFPFPITSLIRWNLFIWPARTFSRLRSRLWEPWRMRVRKLTSKNIQKRRKHDQATIEQLIAQVTEANKWSYGDVVGKHMKK